MYIDVYREILYVVNERAKHKESEKWYKKKVRNDRKRK